MIGLDSNVLVRYLAQDDDAQSARATRLIEKEISDSNPGYVSLVALVETCWVLKRLYAATAAEIEQTVQDLLDARQLTIERRSAVKAALAACAASAGEFADALIAATCLAEGCERVVTFDKGAAKVGMQLLR
jgi:predicted nucleic-acid-binding protein